VEAVLLAEPAAALLEVEAALLAEVAALLAEAAAALLAVEAVLLAEPAAALRRPDLRRRRRQMAVPNATPRSKRCRTRRASW
jgi:hypothetical protein